MDDAIEEEGGDGSDDIDVSWLNAPLGSLAIGWSPYRHHILESSNSDENGDKEDEEEEEELAEDEDEPEQPDHGEGEAEEDDEQEISHDERSEDE